MVAMQRHVQGSWQKRACKAFGKPGPCTTQVVTLEEEWGDWLQGERQADAAVAHFIEAGAATKAVEAALEACAFARAAGQALYAWRLDALCSKSQSDPLPRFGLICKALADADWRSQ